MQPACSLSRSRPTVELRSVLAKSASASAEEIRVQIRNVTSVALKKGAWGKHSEEARAV
jgi:ribosome recycling factor